MHVGMATIFQNPGRARPDLEVHREALRLADLAEPLGFGDAARRGGAEPPALRGRGAAGAPGSRVGARRGMTRYPWWRAER
jgi:hypothetical protein